MYSKLKKFAPNFLDDAVIEGLGDVHVGASDGFAEPLVVAPLLRKVRQQTVQHRSLAEIHVERGSPGVSAV